MEPHSRPGQFFYSGVQISSKARIRLYDDSRSSGAFPIRFCRRVLDFPIQLRRLPCSFQVCNNRTSIFNLSCFCCAMNPFLKFVQINLK